jgi:hypothetical protein
VTGIEFKLRPRNEAIRKLVQACADGELPFSGPGSLCDQVSRMGYSTGSLYEMVVAAQREQRR